MKMSKLKEIKQKMKGWLFMNCKDCPYVSTEIYLTDIGRTVFLTKEEAEKALDVSELEDQ